MPWTLYRYILKDLVKVLALATGVLVVVIAVGAAIKPLSDGVLGPAGLVMFVLYSVPTMLGFALPFAAAFAGTMVFCRMGTDNEITACRAGGMSYRTILLPVFLLGVLLTLSLFYLSNWVVPIFFMKAERQLEHDITKLMVSEISKRQPVIFSNTVLYADAVDDTQPPPLVFDANGQPAEDQPERLIILHGVAVARLDKKGLIRTESTAQQADVLLYRHDTESWVTLQLLNFMVYDAESKTPGLVHTDHSSVLPLRLPNPSRQKLHFLSAPELKALQEFPDRFDDVAAKKEKLVSAVAIDEVIRRIMAGLADEQGKGRLTLLQANQGTLTVTAPHVERVSRARQDDHLHLSATAGAKVHVELSAGGRVTRRLDAASADVVVEVSDQDPEPQIVITLNNETITDAQLHGIQSSRQSLTLQRAWLPEAVMPELTSQTARQLLTWHATDAIQAPAVVNARAQLDYRVAQLMRQILARLHGRAASAVDCLLVLMLGAVLSLKLRGSMPLVVYFWAFVLATIAVVIARSGENVASETAQHVRAGLMVIWSGNVVLAAVIGWVFVRLRQN